MSSPPPRSHTRSTPGLLGVLRGTVDAQLGFGIGGIAGKMRSDEETIATRNTSGRFGVRGWHLERCILEPEVVREVHNFLDARHARLRDAFAEWSGARADGSLAYAAHQRRLPQYEERDLPKDMRHFLTGEFDLETRLDPVIMELLATARVRAFASNFLGSDGYLVHYPPMVRFKVAQADASLVPVHQDAAYNSHLGNFVTVWVPLVDIDEDCGGIVAYEGSHVAETVEHASSGAWANRAVTDVSRFPKVHVLMNAGDALLFPPNLLHESAPHKSDRIRYSIDFRIFSDASQTTKSYFNPGNRKVVRAH